MSLLDDLEGKLEKLFEGFFSHRFKSGLHPIEVAKRLAREMDSKRTVGVAKIYVPNEYTVYVSRDDMTNLEGFEKALVSELAGFLLSHAKSQGYDLVGPPEIIFKTDEDLGLGEARVSSRLVEVEPERPQRGHTQVLSAEEVAEAKMGLTRAELVVKRPRRDRIYPIAGGTLAIGRADNNDVVLADAGVSRFHAEIRWEDDGFVIHDLASTNGTWVNGRRVQSHVLVDGDEIILGETELTYRERNRD